MNDLISRQAAIDALNDGAEFLRRVLDDADIVGAERAKYEWGLGLIESYIYDMKELPSAQQWIPCSDRPPEDLEEVNVTWVNHDPEPYYDFVKDKPFTATAVYYKEKWYWYSSTCADILAEYGRNPNEEIDDGIEIIAWMPLPEPYKGEES